MACGFFSGLTSTLAHAGGPPFAVYIYSLKLDKTLIVATSVAFFGIGNYLKLIPYFFLGQLNTANLSTALLFSPLAPLGVWLGIWLHKRISEARITSYNVCYTKLLRSFRRTCSMSVGPACFPPYKTRSAPLDTRPQQRALLQPTIVRPPGKTPR